MSTTPQDERHTSATPFALRAAAAVRHDRDRDADAAHDGSVSPIWMYLMLSE